MKKLLTIIGILLTVGIIAIAVSCSRYNSLIGPVSDSDEVIEVEITANQTYSTLGTLLKEKGLINDELIYKIYIKLNKPTNLQVGTYELSPNMSIEEIIEKLEKGSNYDPDLINVTFREGLSMKLIADIITKNTNNKEEDIYNLLKDTEYLNSLINDYWFIDKNILNNKLYYSLEGYLFPDTYQLKKDMTVKQIFKIMLDNMQVKLEPYKKQIENSKYTVHEIITLSSMIQSEGNNIDDFKKMASVFLTRLDRNMQLQSCASAYYGDKKIMGVDTFGDSYKKSNNYNTYVIPALPVGPISNPGIAAIDAVLNPSDTNYLYFASDKNMKVYFSSTYQEHQNIVNKLKSEGNWYGS